MKDNVKVVVRLRPILPRERLKKCKKCVRVLKERNQIVLGPSRGFVFDDSAVGGIDATRGVERRIFDGQMFQGFQFNNFSIRFYR